MKLLILGASSYVGARLYFDLRNDFETTGTYATSNICKDFLQIDVTDTTAVEKLILQIKPDVIVHAANNANARWCDANPEEARKLNQESTQSIVDTANKVNARFIYISSFAAKNPTNVYGQTKLASENITKQAKAGWVILRPSLITGYSPNTVNDRPFNRLLKNLDEGTRAEYDAGWQFQPTWLGHLSEVIKMCVEQNISDKTIPVAVPELKSRFDLAKDILGPFNVPVFVLEQADITPTFEQDVQLLKVLGLPTYTYNEIITKTVQEIKNRQKYIL